MGAEAISGSPRDTSRRIIERFPGSPNDANIRRQTSQVGEMRILFLTHYFHPEGNAPATRVSEMTLR